MIPVLERHCVIALVIFGLLMPAAAEGVVGGNPVPAGQFQFVVALRKNKRFFCTGSLIAPKLVLTAAHCVRPKGIGKLQVVTGRRHLRAGTTGTVIDVAAVSRFPTYRKNERHDLALVFLADPAAETPVAVATASEADLATHPGSPLLIAGYGDRRPLYSEVPRYGRLTFGVERVRPYRRCRKAYGRRNFRASTMLCSLGRSFGRKSIGSTSCSGDSGGPLIASTQLGDRLVGVTSYGNSVGNVACGAPGAPSVYARATTEMSFIRSALERAAGG